MTDASTAIDVVTEQPPQPNKERIRKWVEALRSGKYKQAKGYLRVGDKYCCLGVACDIAKADLGISWDHFNNNCYMIDHCQVLPSDSVIKYFGLSSSNCHLEYEGVNYEAWELNDSLGLPFVHIADIIEATYLKDSPNANP